MKHKQIKALLEEALTSYYVPEFILTDPVYIPHRFKLKQDIEIMGFFASILAWGQRKTIINKCLELEHLFEKQPFDFIKNCSEPELRKLEHFVHRTFNSTDLLYVVHFLKKHFQTHKSLETAFFPQHDQSKNAVKKGLTHFAEYFASDPSFPKRTSKHIASPVKKSACKRLNMYLRWMVRQDAQNIDFGIWQHISPSQLICPLDVHVMKTALKLGLLTRDKADWQAAETLTQTLRKFDKEDPVKYDYALFGLSINKPSAKIIGR